MPAQLKVAFVFACVAVLARGDYEDCHTQCEFKFCDKEESTLTINGTADAALSSGICWYGQSKVGIAAQTGEALVISHHRVANISHWAPPGWFDWSFFKTYPLEHSKQSAVGHQRVKPHKLHMLNDLCIVLPILGFQLLDKNGNVLRNEQPHVFDKTRDCISFQTKLDDDESALEEEMEEDEGAEEDDFEDAHDDVAGDLEELRHELDEERDEVIDFEDDLGKELEKLIAEEEEALRIELEHMREVQAKEIKDGNKREKEVAPKKKEVAPKKKEVAPKKKEVAPKKKEVAPKKKEVAPKKKEVAPKKKEVAPKKKEVAPKKKEVAPKKKEAAPKKKEAAPKKKEVAPKKKEVAPKKKEAVPKKKEAAPKKKKVPKKKETAPVSGTSSAPKRGGTTASTGDSPKRFANDFFIDPTGKRH